METKGLTEMDSRRSGRRNLRAALAKTTAALLIAAAAAGTLGAKPATAATGHGIGYASGVVCDPYFNTIQVRARAEAMAGVNVQTIQARFLVEKRMSNGTWATQAIDGYFASAWWQFTHYRWYNNIYSPAANSEPLTITMSSNGTFRVWTQYRFYYGGWTAPTIWVLTGFYTVLPYQSWTYATCNL